VKDFHENVVGNSPEAEAANGDEQDRNGNTHEQTALRAADVAAG
jgi:hypothetical protein